MQDEGMKQPHQAGPPDAGTRKARAGEPGFQFAMLSDAGRVRAGNEDFCAALPERGVFVVCDGMGGAAAGEIASRAAAAGFLECVAASAKNQEVESRLRTAVQAANDAVRQQARMQMDRQGMGTTLVALMHLKAAEGRNRSLWLTHVGDSRCYRLREGRIEMITRDHTLVQEQLMAGQITAEQAERSPLRNIITRAIGPAPKVQAEVRRLAPAPGDVYLLATDGLTREVPDARLVEVLTRAEVAQGDLDAACAVLIEAANGSGGRDNITVLLLRIEA